jgi:putative flavoprotein involved in K+ transport
MSSGTSPRATGVVIIGAGQAGLAMSRCLTDRSVDHVVVERHDVAHAWRHQRWDSLRLLTPNWLTRLPGFEYAAGDPDGYMTAVEVADHLDAYRTSFDAPVHGGVSVTGVDVVDDGFVVDTSQGRWRCRAVVVATGATGTPRIPEFAAGSPNHVTQITPNDYRNPDQLDPGRVLVVGASASGVQIADELATSGRDVTLSVGEHVRVPRTYRGMDIHWWMHTIGLLDESWNDVDDLERARRVPSLQLIGSEPQRTIDLNGLMARGVNLAGRVATIRADRALCSGSLANVCRSADLKQQRLLSRIDEYAHDQGIESELAPAETPPPTRVPSPPNEIDLSTIDTIVWATGFRIDHRWLGPHLSGSRGVIDHDGGVGRLPGVFALGLPFLRRRSSSFIGGVGIDGEELADHVVAHLARRVPPRRHETSIRPSPSGRVVERGLGIAGRRGANAP